MDSLFVKIENFLEETDLNKVIFLFIFGLILGMSLKNIASENFTVGYNDYKLKNLKSDYNLIGHKTIKLENQENSPEKK